MPMTDEELQDLRGHFDEVISALTRYKKAFTRHRGLFDGPDVEDVHRCLHDAQTAYLDRIGYFLTVGNGLSLD